jgi:RNA polymerase sigma factor (sigma-70 family)
MENTQKYSVLGDAMELETLSEDELDVYLKLEMMEGGERARNAVDKAFLSYRRRVMAFLRRRYSSYESEDLEDILQKTFIELYKKGISGEIDPDNPLLKLLCVIADRRAIDHYRSVKSQQKASEKYFDEVGNVLRGTQIGRQWECAKNIEQRNAIQIDFRKFISALPKAERIVANAWASFFPEDPDYEYMGKLIFNATGTPSTVPAMKCAVMRIKKKFKELLFKQN